MFLFSLYFEKIIKMNLFLIKLCEYIDYNEYKSTILFIKILFKKNFHFFKYNFMIIQK